MSRTDEEFDAHMERFKQWVEQPTRPRPSYADFLVGFSGDPPGFRGFSGHWAAFEAQEPRGGVPVTFTAYVGWNHESWPHEQIFWHQEASSFEEARTALLERLRPFLTDECPCCRETGAEEIQSLQVSEGPTWSGEVDGDDYWIEDRPYSET